MLIARNMLMVLTAAALVLQLAGCGQQRPAGGGGTQQKSDTAKDTTTQPQDTTQDTTQDTAK